MIKYLGVVLLVSVVAAQYPDQGRFPDEVAPQRRSRPRARQQDLYLDDTRDIRPRADPRYIQDSAPPQTIERPQRRPLRPATEELRTTPPPIAILRQISEKKDDGSYVYGYEGADGSFKIETRYPDGLVKGKYGYVDSNGKVRVVEYGADKLGFQPSGEGITVPPITIPKETDPFVDYDYPLEEETPVQQAKVEPPPRRRPAQRRPATRRRPAQRRPAQRRPQRIQDTPRPRPQFNQPPTYSQAVPQPISVESIVAGLPPQPKPAPKPRPSPPVYRPKPEYQPQPKPEYQPQPKPEYQPQPQPPRISQPKYVPETRPQEQTSYYKENEIIEDDLPPPPPKPFSFTHEVNFGAPHQQSFSHSFQDLSALVQQNPRPASRPQPRPASRPVQRTAPVARAPQNVQGSNPSILDSLLSQFQLPQQTGTKNVHDITFGLI